MDQKTQLKISACHKKKSGIIEATPKTARKLEQITGMKIQKWRQDNASENKALANRMNDAEWNFKCTFEYTAPGTPQQNSLVEVSFRYLAGLVRAVANMAHLPIDMRYTLSEDLISIAAQLGWLVLVEIDGFVKPL